VKIRRFIAACAVIGIASLGLGAAASEQARADPPIELNESAVFALNVPGSLLADAAPDGVSGAVFAAGQTFNWDYANASYAQVSGTFTPTPVEPDIALTPAEQEAWDEIVRTWRGAPATKAIKLVKAAGGPLTAYMLGAQIGNGLVELMGVDADGLVCAEANGVIGQAVMSVVSGADCEEYNQLVEDFQANADVQPSLVGGTSCTPNGDCMTLVSEQLVQFTAPFGSSNPSQWTSSRFWCLDVSNPAGNSYISYIAPDGTISQTGGNAWPTTHKAYKNLPCEGNRYIAVSNSSLTGQYPAFKPRPTAWVFNPAGPYAALAACLDGTGTCTGGTRALPHDVIADVQRTIVCKVVGTDLITYSASSEPFTEGSGVVPPFVCPELPDGVFAARIVITEEGNEIVNILLDQLVTEAYEDWLDQYQECRNGSCLLELRQDGVSCFIEGIDCDGWFGDPARDSTYTCHYGTHTVPIARCFVYATSYSPTHQSDGTAYADPVTGDSVATPTSPTSVDRVTVGLLERGWEQWGPTPSGLELGQGDEYETTRAVAEECVALGLDEECEERPIFAPGDNVKEAAAHDLDAILADITRAELRYTPTPPVSSGWYSTTPPCVSGTYDSAVVQCDEYPFRSTTSAGPGASLRLILKSDNMNEGHYLNHFYSACGMYNGTRLDYVVVPLVSPGDTTVRITKTAAWC
jgi:hypothetical protein